ncbi:MAG: NAD(P)(+) transhydrogenase (Re/Si-specific) subunit beta [Gammaproteobacteria bacterium]|nr:NAD(P)(+) transhydrogenase (Re/Si-specific) subunit beta [Gammaproteobacteria bacterium]NNC96754.1 NAD(P)(+) transhydrogenase (Re/Si-specific) subunit beta [Gammaproteobacteria bacterium]NNM13516.1 NAD(P)(+) transhydrogenase (Re/Si-specific) subunit beta [Gammaproteobacteria bacterium]
MLSTTIQIVYFIAAILFILGLKAMSSPVTARKGMIWAGVGMLIATFVTFLPDTLRLIDLEGERASLLATNISLAVIAVVIGSWIAYVSAKKVAMTDMPQMVALYNGLGGGAAACIAAIALLQGHATNTVTQVLAVLGALIGAVAFSGSIIAFAKLQGLIWKSWQFKGVQIINLVVFVVSLLLAIYLSSQVHTDGSHEISATYTLAIIAFFVVALIFGITIAMPIGGADMPVVISLFNALTGLAVGLEGFVLQNAAMMIAGTVVGSAGSLLTKLMADAMNRKVGAILFKKFGVADGEPAGEVKGSMKATDATDTAINMAYASKVIIIPGYGMAVAQAQHKVWELAELLRQRDVDVRFAIHPVAGRMPGHMNVLLAEAGVPYDLIEDLEDINAEFSTTDIALVIGANDVVNPIARTDPSSPIFGMPILSADEARNTVVVKRGKGKGFSGIENHLFYADNTRMLYGDAKDAINQVIQSLKEL